MAGWDKLEELLGEPPEKALAVVYRYLNVPEGFPTFETIVKELQQRVCFYLDRPLPDHLKDQCGDDVPTWVSDFYAPRGTVTVYLSRGENATRDNLRWLHEAGQCFRFISTLIAADAAFQTPLQKLQAASAANNQYLEPDPEYPDLPPDVVRIYRELQHLNKTGGNVAEYLAGLGLLPRETNGEVKRKGAAEYMKRLYRGLGKLGLKLN